MLKLNDYEFKPLNEKLWQFLEIFLIISYVSKCYKSKPMNIATKRVFTILNVNYENPDQKIHPKITVTVTSKLRL